MEIHITLSATLVLIFLAETSICGSPRHEPSFLSCLKRSSLSSDVIFTPENPNYEATFFFSVQNNRTLLNSPKPLLIVTPTEEFHVSAAVLCSKELNVPLRTRSGGHDDEGLSYTTTGSSFVLLELHGFRSISVDVKNETVWAEAGATLGELYYAIATESNNTLAFPAGVCPTVGLGGHFSGGGLGTMMRAHGLAIDNIVDARIVVASGEVLDRESMGEDLFWAIRGGGGASFGVILSFKLKLVETPPMVTVFSVDKILEQGAIKLLTKWQQIAYKLDSRLFIRVVLQVLQNPRTLQATFQSLFLGEARELRPLMAGGFPELGLEAKDCTEVSWIRSVLSIAGYSSEDSPAILLDRRPHFNDMFKTKSDFLREPMAEEAWEVLSGWLLGQDARPFIFIDPLGGRMDEIEEVQTPFPHRKGSLYSIQYVANWKDAAPEVAQKNIDWMRKLYRFMRPYVSESPRAAYLNYRDLDLGRNLRRDASYAEAGEWGDKYFKEENFRKLAYVKTKVDPGNLFWNEQSIPSLG